MPKQVQQQKRQGTPVRRKRLPRDPHHTMRHQLREQARPHYVVAGLTIAAAAAHAAATLSGEEGTVATIVASAVLVTTLAAYMLDKLPRRLLPHAAAAGAWLTGVTAAGLSWAAMLLLLIVGYAAALPHWRRHRIPDPPEATEPEQTPDDTLSPPRLWKQNVAEGGPLPGSYLTSEQTIPTGLRYLLHLVPGKQELADAQQVIPKLRTGLKLRPGQDLILEQHPKTDESIVLLTIVRQSQVLTTSQPWPGPTYDRESGTIALGPYVDGDGVARWLLHGDSGLYGGFLTGVTRSGKSRMLESIALGAADAGCVVWFGDPQGGASSTFLAKRADHVARNVDDIRTMLESARQVKELRQAENALNDWDGWTPDQERPGLLLIIDECHRPMADQNCQALATELAREGGKVGIALILASQVATLDAFGTGAGSDALRSSVTAGNQVLLRTRSRNTKAVLVGVDVDPTRFPRIAGYAYLCDDSGSRRSAPLRGYFLDDESRARWASRVKWLSLDSGATNAAGPSYTDRRHLAVAARDALAEKVAAMREGRQPARRPSETAQTTRVITNALGSLRPYQPPPWPPEETAASPAKRKAADVVAELVELGVSSPGEIRARSGYSETAVRAALIELAAQGRVRREGHGTWLPAAAVAA